MQPGGLSRYSRYAGRRKSELNSRLLFEWI